MSEFPYPGLRPFQRDETDIFFGREEHTDQLIEKLGHTHFLAVVGPSGCGKSSLVRTGLLAGLESGFLARAGVHWRIAEFRPGDRPFLRFAEALLADQALGEAYTAPFTDDTESLAFLQVNLHRGPLCLHEILQETSLPEGTSLLILVDQFEEIFRYYQQEDSADKAAAFVALLLASSQHPAVYIVITMRSDFIGDCALFYDLPEAINQGLFLTPRLTREQLRDAIEGPANVFEGEIEPTLVNRLLNDVGSDPDQLPLLQHALMRMWNLAGAENSQQILLTTEHYEQIGRLATALSKHADEAYAELDPAQQRIAEILFCNLTERGTGLRDTRRPVKLEEVARQADVAWQPVATVAEVFRQAGRSFLTPPPNRQLEPESVLDISHESLIRQWQHLKQWTQAEAESAELYQRLEDSARRWQEQRAELWAGIELEIALAWRQRDKPTAVWAKRYGKDQGEYFDLAMRFLDESANKQREEQKQAKQAQKRELQQDFNRKVLMGTLVGLILTTGLAFWGYWERHQALSAEEQARQLEKDRTKSLFKSHLTHAALLARDEDYAKAKIILSQTRELEKNVKAPSRHARDLLAWFSNMMGGEPQETYQDAGAQLLVVAVSPDGQWLAAGGEKGTLVLFDVSSGRLIKRLPEQAENIQALAFEPQNRWLASTGDDQHIILWSLPEGQELLEWEAPATVKALAISPDGTLLASGGEDNNITLWDTATGKAQQVFTGHDDSVSGLTFSPNGKLLGSASYDNTGRLWFLATGGEVSYVLKGHLGELQGIAFSPDGKHVATSSVDESVRLWEVASGKTVRVLQGHQNAVFGLRFVTEGRYLVSASQDRTLRLWDTDSGITLRVLQGHTAGVTHLSSSQAGQLFSSSNDGTVRRWDTLLSNQFIVDLPREEPASVAIAPDGKSVAVGFGSGGLRWYSLPDARLLWEEEVAHDFDIQRLVFNSKGTLLASASFDMTAKLWQVYNDELIEKQTFVGHEDAVNAVAFSPDGHMLATASYDGQIGLFKVGSEQKQFYPAHGGRVYSVSFDSTGTRLLSAGRESHGDEGYTRLWKMTFQPELEVQKPLTLLKEFPKERDRLLWSGLTRDDKQVVSVGRDWLVHLYSIGGSQLAHLDGHEQTIQRAIFSPDNHQVVTVSGDETVRFWDLTTLEELFTLHLPSQEEENMPLWDFDFRCTPQGCWVAVPLTRGKLVLYKLGLIYD